MTSSNRYTIKTININANERKLHHAQISRFSNISGLCAYLLINLTVDSNATSVTLISIGYQSGLNVTLCVMAMRATVFIHWRMQYSQVIQYECNCYYYQESNFNPVNITVENMFWDVVGSVFSVMLF